MSVLIKQASIHDLDNIVPLFDAYRQFYGKTSDIKLAREFLTDRLKYDESIIFVALNEGAGAVGFTQLYPSFSSTRAARTFILNDLYVVPELRRTGIATALLEQAARFSRTAGAARLSLSTARTNVTAQALYESLGWKRDDEFCEFGLVL
jgi:GNAT superfamily N-acetyltransferase